MNMDINTELDKDMKFDMDFDGVIYVDNLNLCMYLDMHLDMDIRQIKSDRSEFIGWRTLSA